MTTTGMEWEAVAITVSRIEGLHGQPGWRCRTCGLILGGAPARKPLETCPICAAARGELVAILLDGGDTPRMSTIVGDQQFRQLVENYRAAKSATSSDEADDAAVSTRGSYDVDGDMATRSSETHRSEEHHSALALADAALSRSD